MSEQYRNFMGYLWVQKEDNVYTIGINEEGLEQITEIESVDLPRENEEIEADVVIGSIETSDGPLDLYSPVAGKVVEINNAVFEDPEEIQEDPYDAWLVKVESEEEMDAADEEDEEEDDDDEDEDEEDYNEEE
jgi:glycine cleavage system H protein